MKHFKINIGRKDLSSDYIRSKQNFDGILQKIQASSSTTSIWKLWSYGISSLAGIALLVGIYYTDSNRHVAPNAYAATNTIARSVDQTNFDEIQNHQTSNLILAMNSPCDPSNHCTHLKSETIAQCVIKNKKKTEKVNYTEQKTSLSDQNTSTLEQQNTSAVAHALYIDHDKKGVKPSISGIYSGDIAWSQFNNSSVAIHNEHLQVSSFSIQYTSRRGDKTVAVQGNKIPKEVLADLDNIAVDQKVFITNVVANDKNGEKNHLTPIELNLKFDVLQPATHEHDTTAVESK